jgi:hypothetical protein
METRAKSDPEKVEVKYQTVPDPVEVNDEITQPELEYTNLRADGENVAWDLETER